MPEIKPPAPRPTKGLTQQQKIVAFMCQHPDTKWWLPTAFMRPAAAEFFVGYEASARFSELASDYPDMFESRRNGKYIERRIKFETMPEWIKSIGVLASIVNMNYKPGVSN